MKPYHGKAHRSPKARVLLENREHARQLFNAIKALSPEAPLQLVSVAGVTFRSEARLRQLPAND